MDRKRATALMSTCLALGLIAGCGEDGAGGEQETVRLGVVGTVSGPQAEIGENIRDGAKIAAEILNESGGADGRQIEIVVQDEQASPEAAAAAVRNHVNDGVMLQLGMLSSANCLAVAPTLESLNAVFIASTCSNDDLTGKDGQEAPHKNFFRVAAPDSQIQHALTNVVADRFANVSVYQAFNYDYVTGRSQWQIFQDDLNAAGIDVKVARETWVPLGEQNYGPLVASVAREADATKEPDGLYLGTFGAGTAAFMQQAEPFDIADKFELIAQGGGYYPVARTLNGKAPKVWNSYDYNYAAYDSDMNKQFVEAFEEETGKKPVTWSHQGFLAVLAYAAAIEKAGSTEPADVIAALEGVTFESTQGEVTMDAVTHQLNGNSVVTFSEGDPEAPEGVKILETITVSPSELQ